MKTVWGIMFAAVIIVAWSGQALSFPWKEIYSQSARAVVVVMGAGVDGKGMTGTGSIIDPKGLVLTNAHVVIENTPGKAYPRLFVFFKPEKITGKAELDLANRYEAQLVAFNQVFDLALLKVEKMPGSFSPLSFADPTQVEIGDPVAAIGHPEQGGFWSLTTGVVSAQFQDYQNRKGWDVFQTEASLNRGNSGGPLLDGEGRIIGVNTMVARMASDGFVITDVNFSVQSHVARDWLQQQGVDLKYMASAPSRPVANEPKMMEALGEARKDPLKEESAEAKPRREAFQATPSGPSDQNDRGSDQAQKKRPAEQKGAELLTEAHPYDMDKVVSKFTRLEEEMGSLMDSMREELRRKR